MPQEDDKVNLFGLELILILIRKGYARSHVAAQAGITPQYLSSLCTGKKGLSASMFTELCTVLKISGAQKDKLARAAAETAINKSMEKYCDRFGVENKYTIKVDKNKGK